jgi:hypothetical protein
MAVPISPLRVGAAQVLDVMRRTVAPVTVVTEVDMTVVQRLRASRSPRSGERPASR